MEKGKRKKEKKIREGEGGGLKGMERREGREG